MASGVENPEDDALEDRPESPPSPRPDDATGEGATGDSPLRSAGRPEEPPLRGASRADDRRTGAFGRLAGSLAAFAVAGFMLVREPLTTHRVNLAVVATFAVLGAAVLVPPAVRAVRRRLAGGPAGGEGGEGAIDGGPSAATNEGEADDGAADDGRTGGGSAADETRGDPADDEADGDPRDGGGSVAAAADVGEDADD